MQLFPANPGKLIGNPAEKLFSPSGNPLPDQTSQHGKHIPAKKQKLHRQGVGLRKITCLVFLPKVLNMTAQAPDAAGKTPGLNGQEIGAGPGTLWCGTAGPGLRAVFGLSPGLPFCPVGRWGWLRTPSVMFLLFHKSPLEYENHKKLQIVTAPYHTSF